MPQVKLLLIFEVLLYDSLYTKSFLRLRVKTHTKIFNIPNVTYKI